LARLPETGLKRLDSALCIGADAKAKLESSMRNLKNEAPQEERAERIERARMHFKNMRSKRRE
jgi:hypothetical protein